MDDGLACVDSLRCWGAPFWICIYCNGRVSKGVSFWGCISTCFLGFHRCGDIAGHTLSTFSFSVCSAWGYLARYTTDRRFCLFCYCCFLLLSFPTLFILIQRGTHVSLAGYARMAAEKSASLVDEQKIDGIIARQGMVALGLFFV